MRALCFLLFHLMVSLQPVSTTIQPNSRVSLPDSTTPAFYILIDALRTAPLSLQQISPTPCPLADSIVPLLSPVGSVNHLLGPSLCTARPSANNPWNGVISQRGLRAAASRPGQIINEFNFALNDPSATPSSGTLQVCFVNLYCKLFIVANYRLAYCLARVENYSRRYWRVNECNGGNIIVHLNEIINLWLWRWLQSSFEKESDGGVRCCLLLFFSWRKWEPLWRDGE